MAVICVVVVLPAIGNRVLARINTIANLGLPLIPERAFNLGLDLQGGAHLIYRAETKDIPIPDRADAVEGVRDVIERRVRGGLGVAEPLVQTTRVSDDHRIIVELPGVTDVKQAIAMIGETPVLEFKEENTDPPRALTPEEERQLTEDNARAEQKALEAAAKISGGMSFAEAVKKYSEDAATKGQEGNLGFVARERYSELYDWAKGQRDGVVSAKPIRSLRGWHIVKRLASRSSEKEVQAAHLLICYKGAERCDGSLTKEQAKAKIEEIKKDAKPENFAALVKQYSTEPGAGERGGDLGSFRRGAMVKPFEEAIWDAPVKAIIGPVETQFGWHLIYKKGEAPLTEYQLAQVFVATKQKTDILPPPEPWKPTGLSGKQLKRAEVATDPNTGQVQVSLQFNDEGARLFGEITGRNVNKQVAIFLDGTVISDPRVSEAITSGSAVISGSFTLAEAKQLAQRLNAGALPVPVELLSQQKVDATLGADSLAKSFRAGVVGLILVMIFMVLYYRLPGLLSVFSLLVYAVLNLALFKLMGVTLTLSGIAAFILSVGMAVDTNVLVFERLKEELRSGGTLRAGLEEAFIRSWPSIRDGHVTTLLSCLVLLWFGTGFIKGFAVVLATGTLVSLFTAISVTRTVFRFIAPWCGERGSVLFLGHQRAGSQSDNLRHTS